MIAIGYSYFRNNRAFWAKKGACVEVAPFVRQLPFDGKWQKSPKNQEMAMSVVATKANQ